MMATPQWEIDRREVLPAQYMDLPDIRGYNLGDQIRVVAAYSATMRDGKNIETKVTATRTTVLELRNHANTDPD